MIARSTPLPEPPHPNAWLPLWSDAARIDAERADVLRAALDGAEGETATALREALALREASRDAHAALAAESDPIWPGAWFALPSQVGIAAGWRIHRLYTAMDALPAGAMLLPYMGAAIGLLWSACGAIPEAKAPTGLPDVWTDDALLLYGWRVVAELQAVGCSLGEIMAVGRICRIEVDRRIQPVSEGAVRAKVDFSGRARDLTTASSAKPASGTPETPTP